MKNSFYRFNDRAEFRVMELLSGEARFTYFNQAIKMSGLGSVFLRLDDCTVFAPTDAAFSELSPGTVRNLFEPKNVEELRRLVTLHWVPFTLRTDDLSRVAALRTVDGQEIVIKVAPDRSQITLGNARVSDTPDLAMNGVVYPLDRILHGSVAEPTYAYDVVNRVPELRKTA